MPPTPPEWLARRECNLRPTPDGHSWAVMMNGHQQYLITPKPAAGKYTCQVMQTINGKRLDAGQVYNSVDEALSGGLEELRKSLGW